jgi:hypothetical protein
LNKGGKKIMKLDWTQVILNAYTQSWFMWIGFLIIGFLLFKFSEYISVNNRDNRKMENAGIKLMSIGIVIHTFAIAAFIKSM